MAVIYIGSARHDEDGNLSHGQAGDQLQISNTFDTKGEVSIQYFYVHKKGWNIIRPVAPGVADRIAQCMIDACNNPNIGYDQNNRLAIITSGIKTVKPTECDCSSLVRAIAEYVISRRIDNFTTANCLQALIKTGSFTNVGQFISQEKTPVYDGDILCTRTKGHVVVVVQGNPRIKKLDKPTVAMPTLRRSSCGIQVRYLQQDLNYLTSSGLVTDGKFGPKTEKVLKEWQAASGLKADGVYGPLSYETMVRLMS